MHKVFCTHLCYALTDWQSIHSAKEMFGNCSFVYKMPGSCMLHLLSLPQSLQQEFFSSPLSVSIPLWLEGIREVTNKNIPSTLNRQVGRVLKDPPPSNTLQPTPIEQFQLQRGGRCCSGAKRYCLGVLLNVKPTEICGEARTKQGLMGGRDPGSWGKLFW